MATILIVDDDAALRESLTETLVDLGHQALEAASGLEALSRIRANPVDAVLLDLKMPDMEGIEVLRHIRALERAAPVIVLTAFASPDNTIEAMRLGAFDHVTKPIGRSELAGILERALRSRVAHAAGPPQRGDDGADTLIGSSEAMRQVQKTIGLAADSDATVLILGETGTGKEMVARALHRHSSRSARLFIAVNCAAIPGELLESELFGHVRGAFTGAVADRHGAFGEANGGTLFLDEIGDMTLAMQAKILRALQERAVTPVGGRSEAVDVRIIAATHRDLPSLVRDGRFRDDLYYRLNVVPLVLPPLRERIADIVPLAEHFLALVSPIAPKRLSAAGAARLVSYSWPGNIRELKNAMERVSVLVRGDGIAASDLEFLADAAPVSEPVDWLAGDLTTAVARLEAAMIRRALAATNGNRAEAARRLNIHRQLLYAKMRRYGLDDEAASEDATGGVGTADKSPRESR